jgi:ornithine cyclodeaminase/alanine dehydrogenase-like protein (mu-crystallin family)
VPLLLDRKALRPLFTEARWIEESFQIIERSLLEGAGCFSWLQMPLADGYGQGDGRRTVNVQVETVPPGGGYVRVYPDRSAAAPSGGHPALLLDADGRLLALLAADDLNAWRTAAPVAVAARVLARPGARTVTVLGSGRQAEHHIRALRTALPTVETIYVHSRTAEHRERLAATIAADGVACRAVSDPAEAVASSDVISVTGRGYGDPLIDPAPKDGALVTSILPITVPDAHGSRPPRLVVPSLHGPESRSSGWDPPHGPPGAAAGRTAGGVAVTLADVLRGTADARAEPGEVVVYEQRGQFGWDHALMRWAYLRASETGAGVPFDLV